MKSNYQLLILVLCSLSSIQCASTKPYTMKTNSPNLTVGIEIPEGSLFTAEFAELYVYEDLGNCNWFYFGFVELNKAKTLVSIPLNKKIILDFVRTTAGYKYRTSNSENMHVTPKPRQEYMITYREIPGASELLFKSRRKNTKKYKTLKSTQSQICEKVNMTQ